MKVVDEIRVVGIGHPMVGVLPRQSMSRDRERYFLWDRRGLRWAERMAVLAEGGEE